MIIWLSTHNVQGQYKWPVAAKYLHYLGSFIENQYLQDAMTKVLAPHDFNVFLDSGAYSAWSRGAHIDLEEYIAFIRHNIEYLSVVANLDHIAGTPGTQATQAQRNEGARKSWENYLRMRDAGIEALPVFHAGEDWSWLDMILKSGVDYVGLGGLVGLEAEPRRRWLDNVFERLCDADGNPCVKTHGFGMTSVPLIFRYPWHSVDSTTWIQVAANGGVYLPQARPDGQFLFDRVPNIISMSLKNPKAMTDGKHVNSLPSASLEVLDRWLAYCGQDRAGCSNHYGARATCNAVFFREVAGSRVQRTFDFRNRGPASLWGAT